jgi:hypothetical protein
VSITRRDGQYFLDWRIGSSSYSGVGTVDRGILAVDWGATTPVVYGVLPGGVLKGLWGTGKRRRR